jgi:hypothetical protein
MDFYTLADFYVKGYEVVRASETILDGNNEVMVVIHDAFQVSPGPGHEQSNSRARELGCSLRILFINMRNLSLTCASSLY